MKQGRVIINRSICDNAPECSGIEVCPSGALSWDEEKERIEFNLNQSKTVQNGLKYELVSMDDDICIGTAVAGLI